MDQIDHKIACSLCYEKGAGVLLSIARSRVMPPDCHNELLLLLELLLLSQLRDYLFDSVAVIPIARTQRYCSLACIHLDAATPVVILNLLSSFVYLVMFSSLCEDSHVLPSCIHLVAPRTLSTRSQVLLDPARSGSSSFDILLVCLFIQFINKYHATIVLFKPRQFGDTCFAILMIRYLHTFCSHLRYQ
jgi:hypothetical protein